jgi:hypothetical protein
LRVATSIRRPEGKILICLLLAAPFLLTAWVHGDGIGHFVFLHSAIIDGDLDLANEYDYVPEHIIPDAAGLPAALLKYSSHTPGYHPGYHRPPPDPVTGRLPSNWSIGPALLWTPAYALAHVVSLAAHAAGLPVRTDGYGGLYYLALALATLGYGAAGLLIAFRIAARAVGEREAFWATLTIAAASPLLYYLYMAPSHSHGLTVFTVALFLWAWLRHRNDATSRVHFVWGLLAGMMFLVRWNDALLLIPVLVAESSRLLRASNGGLRRGFFPWLRCMVTVFAGFALVAWPQFAVWQYLHGRPWVRHSVDTLQITPAGLWGTLFSWNHGLFTWTPVVLLAVLGLLPLWRRDRPLAGLALGIFAALVVSNCTVYDWWAGTAFGQRRMISATPVYVLGLASFYLWAQEAWKRRFGGLAPSASLARLGRRADLMAPATLALFGIWNVLLLAQFSLGMISHTESVPFALMATNQPKVIARLIEVARQILR